MLNLNGTATVDLGPKISMDFTPLSNEHGTMLFKSGISQNPTDNKTEFLFCVLELPRSLMNLISNEVNH